HPMLKTGAIWDEGITGEPFVGYKSSFQGKTHANCVEVMQPACRFERFYWKSLRGIDWFGLACMQTGRTAPKRSVLRTAWVRTTCTRAVRTALTEISGENRHASSTDHRAVARTQASCGVFGRRWLAYRNRRNCGSPMSPTTLSF